MNLNKDKKAQVSGKIQNHKNIDENDDIIEFIKTNYKN